MANQDSLERELEARVEALGYELVELERAGSKTRPLLRLRIDKRDSAPGEGVSLNDCTKVSRALEPFLDQHPSVSDRYVLEVSSPGVERPLVKPRDFERFAGQDVVVKTREPLGDHGKRIEGKLLGLADDTVRVQLGDDDTVEIPREQISRAKLLFKWEE